VTPIFWIDDLDLLRASTGSSMHSHVVLLQFISWWWNQSTTTQFNHHLPHYVQHAHRGSKLKTFDSQASGSISTLLRLMPFE
jgi:hypothetical protein